MIGYKLSPGMQVRRVNPTAAGYGKEEDFGLIFIMRAMMIRLSVRHQNSIDIL